MKRILVAMPLIAVLLGSVNAFAVDRLDPDTANITETIGVEAAYYDGQSTDLRLSIWSERSMQHPPDLWAVVAGLTYGELDMDNDEVPEGEDENPTSWSAALGVKRYIGDLSSLALIGSYGESTYISGTDVGGFRLEGKHRLISAQEVFSPYFKGSIGFLTATVISDEQEDDDWDLLVYTVGVGCDLLQFDEGVRFVFEIGMSDSINLGSGDDYADGFQAGLYMMFDWDSPR